jgi:hypothetical protein
VNADGCVSHPARRFSCRDDSNASRRRSAEGLRNVGPACSSVGQRTLGELGSIDRTDPGPENCQEIGS